MGAMKNLTFDNNAEENTLEQIGENNISEDITKEKTETTTAETPQENTPAFEGKAEQPPVAEQAKPLQVDLFSLTGETPPPPVEKTKVKSEKACCAAPKSAAGKKTDSSSKPETKEPPKGIQRLVVLQNNEQFPFDGDMTLEEIRGELAKDYPMYTEKNTKWHWEEQKDLNRILCIPTATFNKAG